MNPDREEAISLIKAAFTAAGKAYTPVQKDAVINPIKPITQADCNAILNAVGASHVAHDRMKDTATSILKNNIGADQPNPAIVRYVSAKAEQLKFNYELPIRNAFAPAIA